MVGSEHYSFQWFTPPLWKVVSAFVILLIEPKNKLQNWSFVKVYYRIWFYFTQHQSSSLNCWQANAFVKKLLCNDSVEHHKIRKCTMNCLSKNCLKWVIGDLIRRNCKSFYLLEWFPCACHIPKSSDQFCVFAMTITRIRCISIGNKYQSHRHNSLSNRLNWLVTVSPSSQQKNNKSKVQHTISDEIITADEYGLEFYFGECKNIEQSLELICVAKVIETEITQLIRSEWWAWRCKWEVNSTQTAPVLRIQWWCLNLRSI